ncbi:DUF2586 domain-containing protein [Candidatus Magnetomoraceae bacterium gMMP-15]
MGDVIQILKDGTSGLAPGSVEGACMAAGICSKGETGKAYILGPSSNVEESLGVGPLVDRLRDIFATGGQEARVIAVPVDSVSGGTVSAITKTGNGPTITASGSGKVAADVIIKIVSGGARNIGTYRLSVDGGDAWGTVKTIPVDGVIAVGDTGVTVIVPESPDTETGDTYSFTISPPLPSISGVINKLETPLENYAVEFVYIIGASDSSDWAVMGAKADEKWNVHKPTFFIAEARLPGNIDMDADPVDADETIDEWVTALKAEKDSYSHRFVDVCSAYGEVSDSSGKTITRNWGGLLTGRLLKIPVQRAIGRVRDGGISQGTLPEDFTEAHQKALEEAGFITAKNYVGLSSPYWGDGKTLAEKTSDYQYVPVVRTVFKAMRLLLVAATKSMYDEIGDPLLSEGSGIIVLKNEMTNAVNTMITAIPQELAGVVINIPDGQDYVNNGVGVEVKLVGIPIIREITMYASYYYAGSSFDPRLKS